MRGYRGFFWGDRKPPLRLSAIFFCLLICPGPCNNLDPLLKFLYETPPSECTNPPPPPSESWIRAWEYSKLTKGCKGSCVRPSNVKIPTNVGTVRRKSPAGAMAVAFPTGVVPGGGGPNPRPLHHTPAASPREQTAGPIMPDQLCRLLGGRSLPRQSNVPVLIKGPCLWCCWILQPFDDLAKVQVNFSN